MKSEFMEFLVNNNLYPIEIHWNQFRIMHGKPRSESERQVVRLEIDGKVGKRNGLYVYMDLKGNLLYIGKARPLRNRLLSHYRESYEKVPGDTKNHRWHCFFSQHQGELIIYWIEIEDEKARVIVEQMLDYLLEPTFNDFF